MRFFFHSSMSALALAALVTQISAQTFSSCNPTLQGGCAADPALGTSKSIAFTGGASNEFTAAGGGSVTYTSDGAGFTVARAGDSPTLISKWYIMFGHVEYVVKAAPGAGIVSSALLQSDALDEIDWEWLGGDNSQVQSNYFAKGAGAGSRGGFHAAPNNHDQFHTYTLDWTADQLVWQIDGVTVRAVTASSAGSDYPQTPMHVRVGAWAGGDPATNAPGTVEWAGGPVDYSAGPYTMYIKSIRVTDYSTGSSYSYGDMSGTWQSIRSQGGKINSGSGGTPVDTENAPGVTSPVTETAPPLGFTPSNSDSAYETRTGYPWVLDSATASAVTSVSGVYTSIAGLPSGWTISDSGKIQPPSGSLSPVSSPGSPLPSGLSERTTYNDQGFQTTITYDPATATLPVSYDGQGFPITTPLSLAPNSSPQSSQAPSSVLATSPESSETPSPDIQTGNASLATAAPSSTLASSAASSGAATPSSGLTPSVSSDATPLRSSTSATSEGGSIVKPTSTQATLTTTTVQSTRISETSSTTANPSDTPAAPEADSAGRVDIGVGVVAVLVAMCAAYAGNK